MIERLQWLRQNFSMPIQHEIYLKKQYLNPKVIYDIGSCTLHWYDMARRIWPDAKIYVFDAMQNADVYYASQGLDHYAGLLGDQDGDVVNFWSNAQHPAGNSIYRENPVYSPQVDKIYSDQHKSYKLTRTLDSVIEQYNWPKPDLIKMDVQGSELNILKGAVKCLEHVTDLILEVQSLEYNIDAPMVDQITDYLKLKDFQLIADRFSGDHIQGDAHYKKLI